MQCLYAGVRKMMELLYTCSTITIYHINLYGKVAKYNAHAMYACSRAVSKHDRDIIAREMVEKYPKLNSSNAQCPYESLAYFDYAYMLVLSAQHAIRIIYSPCTCRIKWFRKSALGLRN